MNAATCHPHPLVKQTKPDGAVSEDLALLYALSAISPPLANVVSAASAAVFVVSCRMSLSSVYGDDGVENEVLLVPQEHSLEKFALLVVAPATLIAAAPVDGEVLPVVFYVASAIDDRLLPIHCVSRGLTWRSVLTLVIEMVQ